MSITQVSDCLSLVATMRDKQQLAFQKQLERIYKLIKSGSPLVAISDLKVLSEQFRGQPDVLHLLALAYREVGNFETSAKYFDDCLALSRSQPQVLNNLANLKKDTGEFQAAISLYREALRLMPNFKDAFRNLGLCYLNFGKYIDAESVLSEVVSKWPNDVVAVTALGNCYRDTGQLEMARQAYTKAIEINPEYKNAWNNLGNVSQRLNLLGEAVQCFRRIYEMTGENQYLLNLAVAMTQLGDKDSACALLDYKINESPLDVSLHECLNDILWESGLTNQFCGSYEKVLKKITNDEAIWVSYIERLLVSGQPQKASAKLDQALTEIEESAPLIALKAKILADDLNFKEAYDVFKHALFVAYSAQTAQQFVKLCIILEKYSEAQSQLDVLLENEPECQFSWALQGLVWQFTDSTKARWLNNYDEFVRTYTLPVPSGYVSLDSFLHNLHKVLDKKHKADQAPLQQTLRFGTQTAPKLFDDSAKPLRDLLTVLPLIVRRYIDALPDDDSHPFLSRKSKNFRFSGSWSVKLKPDGFHVNHIHPQGWISSSFYVFLPPVMSNEGSNDLGGAIKFGESPLGLGEREQVSKIIKPRTGMVVLFPSYFWHGTYPFSGVETEYRLTSPFDVVPMEF